MSIMQSSFRMMKRIGVGLLVSFVCSSQCLADGAVSLADRLGEAVNDPMIPAMSVLLFRDGAVVEQLEAGVRSVGSDAPVTPDDRWHLASCTKAMTALLAAVSVARGEIAWETTVGESFPELVETMEASYAGATLRDLLTHRAGVPGSGVHMGMVWMMMRGLDAEEDRLGARYQSVRMALGIPPVGARGEKFEYTNLGYVVAGAMLERATGVVWESLMQERIFGPLGMASAGFGPPPAGEGGDYPANAVGHQVMSGRLVAMSKADNPLVSGPGTNVHATMRDWAKFVWEIVAGASGGETVLGLDQALYIDLLTPPENAGDDAYALGWGVFTDDRDWGGGRSIQHAGSNTMWYCVAEASIEQRCIVLVACNSGTEQAHRATIELLRVARKVLMAGDESAEP
ncbi:MAG: class A beta-lactamase-related serine hydrolase [Phycisphaeraceae bacterium]|nr:MAG: class A beta-lactamase-related serine hydrolase [Phycisphaeraceae bacterium]